MSLGVLTFAKSECFPNFVLTGLLAQLHRLTLIRDRTAISVANYSKAWSFWSFGAKTTQILIFPCELRRPSTKGTYSLPSMLFVPRKNKPFWYVTHKVHLQRGGVPRFTTQPMSWRGLFCTFIIHAPRTDSKTGLKLAKHNRMSSAAKFRWKLLIFLSEVGSARFANLSKVTVKWFYQIKFVQLSWEQGKSLFFLGANNMLWRG